MALGIISFGFLSIVGMLPLGMDTSRRAKDSTIEAQIRRLMVNQAQQTDFSRLAGLAERDALAFDAQGSLAGAERTLYRAAFDVTMSTDLPGSTSSRLATVTIYILNTSSPHGKSQGSLASNPGANKYTVLVADNGR